MTTSYAGSEIDLAKRKYLDMFTLELQQKGDILGNLVTIIPGEFKEMVWDSLGEDSDPIPFTGTLQPTVYSDSTYRRRIFSFQAVEKAKHIDTLDSLDRGNPREAEITRNMIFSVGRQRSNIIKAAISGNSAIIEAGVTSNVALPSGQKIASTSTAYGATSGGGLQKQNIMAALAILGSNFVEEEDVFVVGKHAQLMNLYKAAEAASRDYRSVHALEVPGLIKALDGYLGCRYVAYEGFDQVSSKDTVYVFPRSAIIAASRLPLTVDIFPDKDFKLNPLAVKVFQDFSAIRTDEKKVVQISAEPISLA